MLVHIRAELRATALHLLQTCDRTTGDSRMVSPRTQVRKMVSSISVGSVEIKHCLDMSAAAFVMEVKNRERRR